MTETCGAPKTDGEPCASRIIVCEKHGACFRHDPCRAEESRAAAAAGGRATAVRRGRSPGKANDVRTVDPAALPFDGPPTTIEQVHAWLAWVAYAGLVGVVDRDTAGKVAYALDKCRIAMERGEKMDDRLKRIEQRLRDRGHA